ncbi:ribokinase, partial [Mesorhizobium sp. M7D.F.Ca.US.004.03.1.1]
VRMVGAVGKDSFAAEALALLRDGKVDLSGVAETFASTGTALIMVGDDGENIIAVVPGANASVLPGDLAKAFLKKGDVVLLQHEIPLATVDAALDQARAAGAITVLNTAPFQGKAAAFLAKADYAVANETEFDLYGEALALNGRDRAARMRDFAAKTGRTIVVTLGGDGVMAATPSDFLSVPALKITPVDTVGAGDTFCGYFAAGLSSGLTLE